MCVRACVCFCVCVFACVCARVCVPVLMYIHVCVLRGEVNYTVLSHQPQARRTDIWAFIPPGPVGPLPGCPSALSPAVRQPLPGLKPVATRPRVQPNALRRC